MKTALSHIMPVWQACEVLGDAKVNRIVSTLVQLRRQGKPSVVDANNNNNNNNGFNNNDSSTNSNTPQKKKEQLQQQQHKTDEEIQLLARALKYRHPPPAYPDTPIPPTVQQGWKMWSSPSTQLQLDRATLLAWLVPANVRPFSGAAGHQGLFDCWIYTLQGHGSMSSSPSSPSFSNNSNSIQVGDVIIFLAICQQYNDLRNIKNPAEESHDDSITINNAKKTLSASSSSGLYDSMHEREEGGGLDAGDGSGYNLDKDGEAVATMARLTFRIYDAYQKKGVVARDTIHRFWTDVYGESLLQEYQSILTELYNGDVSPQALIGEAEFGKRVREHKLFVVMDWMGELAAHGFMPVPRLPLSTSAYLDTIQSQMAPPLPLCDMYALAEYRLYEIKRRFHSLTLSSKNIEVIQGDPMSEQAEITSTSEQQASSSSSTTTTSNASPFRNYQAISESAFIKAVSLPNSDLGHGGYLPKSIAKLLFRTGGCLDPALAGSSSSSTTVSTNSKDESLHGSSSSSSSSPYYWSLYQVLQFGCMAVRSNVIQADFGGANHSNSNKHRALLRFLFRMFQLTAVTEDDYNTSNSSINNSCSVGGGTNGSASGGATSHVDSGAGGGGNNTMVLNRLQVTHMLLLLNEFADFRRMADAPVNEEDSTDVPSLIPNDDHIEESLMEEESAIVLGLLSPAQSDALAKNTKSSQPGYVKLSELVDIALEGTVAKNQMTFDEFCKWEAVQVSGGPPSRCAFLMLELRLVAAVLFGIPPTDASMEVMLIGEIEGRHKERYPQSDVSRRGPRGTIWYLIDAEWLKQWASLVKKITRTPSSSSSDGGGTLQDMRGALMKTDTTKVRGLDCINNRGLLADDKSLNLRPDIRWKHDYEILPPLGWSALQAWYDGGPPIYRTVVRYVTAQPASPHTAVPSSRMPRIPTENELELYPLFVTVYLCDAVSRGEARPFQQNYQLSRVSPVMVMKVQLCKELDIEPEMARLWVMETNPDAPPPSSSPTSTSLVAGSPSTVKDAGALEDWILNLDQNIIEQRKRRAATHHPTIAANDHGGKGIILLFELKDKESGMWPRGIDGKEWSFISKNKTEVRRMDIGDGIVGLYNMGNTCYLNSSIQCISHTPILREYFTAKAYLRDINKTNPLGHGGQLAQVSAVLVNSLWKRFNQSNPHPPNRIKAPGSYAMVQAPSLTPKTFKESLGKFSEHFAGNEQHDAQELLAFLLAGLSEDLNRIVDKPYIEAPDSDGRPDAELADIWWTNHLKREMSIIVALFTGQYKSLLTCRTCSYESARFEPFMFLQLPLPEDDYLSVALILYPLKDGAETMKYCVRVKTDGKLKDVLIELAKVLHADEVAEEKSNKMEDETKSEEFFVQKSQNLAVVDLRDGYISKIAPNSWALVDLQNKESGELPLLHVYELDPITEDPPSEKAKEEEAKAEGDSAEEPLEKFHKPKRGFLAVAQRRSELTSQNHLHPFTHRVFGTPLLMRVEGLESKTGRELYGLIARRLRNVVPKAAQRFLIDNIKEESCSNGESSASMSLTQDSPMKAVDRGANRTTTDMEEVSAGTVPRYGFRLRLTCRDGRRCLTCPWYDSCIGCYVPDDDYATSVMDGDSLVVDWHFAVDLATSGFGTRSNPSDPAPAQASPSRPKFGNMPIKNHISCGVGVNKKQGLGGAITLEECLDAFAKEEKIPEAYCSRCKDFRVQTKRMSLWRLPPVVIIHLKRFQFTQQMRRKLRDLVLFPVEGLDLSRITASDSQGLKLRAEKPKENGGAMEDPMSNPTTKDNGRDEQLYDLYAVVHHQGALSGGHYVASLKSEIDGQWRLFNDAQIYEIHARDVVDASAYILFYIRRDVAKAQLSDYWEVPAEGEGVSEEDMENLMSGRSDRCVIS